MPEQGVDISPPIKTTSEKESDEKHRQEMAAIGNAPKGVKMPGARTVRVSVITLTWNHLEYTKKAVESIKPILTKEDEIIFVDNLSTDGTQEYLQSLELPCPKYLLSPKEQCGIGAAYNIAFRKAKGAFIFIYDNDLEIMMPNTLDHLIKVHQMYEKAGIVAPCCDNIMGRYRVAHSQGKLKNDIMQIRLKWNKAWPENPSAAWLISKECREKVGFWDELFDPYGMGDYDYGKRVLLAGFELYADRYIFVKHYGGVTAKAYTNSDMFRDTRLKFYKKWGYPAPGEPGVPKGGTPRIRNR